MLIQHLRFIIRNIRKHKSSFLINLIGLSSGLTCTLLIYLWIYNELQIDQFHRQAVYQVMQNEHLSDVVQTTEGTPGILAEALATQFPVVEKAVTTSPDFWLGHSKVGSGIHPDVVAAGKFAGPEFFKVFSYPLLTGNANTVLNGARTAVISESLAKKLFKSTDVVGKELLWSNAELDMENRAQISGVFKDITDQSSERFDFLISLDVMLDAGNSTYRKWGNYGPSTYVVLSEDAHPGQFNKQIKNFLKTKGVENYTLFIRPYAEAYLYNQTENGKITGGRIDYVKLFGFAALLILLIACINFTNLASAKASRRLKEIGVKKTLGISRFALFMQYMIESLIMSSLAMIISLLTTELVLPSFNQITGKNLTLDPSLSMAGSMLAITLVTGLLAGIYPAIYLSGLKPVTALKGKLQFSAGSLWMRQGLVIFQFICSGILIVAVLVVYQQVKYVQTKSQGFQKENVLYFEAEGKIKNSIPSALEAIRKIDGVINAAAIDRELLGDLSYTTGTFDWEGRNPEEVIRFQRADVSPGLIETLGMKIVQGRSFSASFGADTTNVIINEAGIKAMRLKNPVGKVFTLWGNPMQIIGVVGDFHFESMHKPIGPMFMRDKPANLNRIMIRTAPGKLPDVIEKIEKFHAGYNPGYHLDFKFLDQDFKQQYLSETRMATLSRYFAVLAIVISCLGLFGLAAFSAEKRFKEVGIRKVLGASHWNVMYSLSKDFMKPVVISILISLPLAYILCHRWLASFVYHIDLEWWLFAVAGAAAIGISMATVFSQAYKAAKMSPVSSLKVE